MNLDLELGTNPEEIFDNLENRNYSKDDILYSDKLASDDKYSEIVREINSSTPFKI